MKKAMLLMAVVMVSGCGPDLQGNPDETGSELLGTTHEELGATVIVKIVGTAFVPASVSVKKGTTVKFMNVSPMGHTVTSGTGSGAAGAGAKFDKNVAAGKSVSVKFNTVGTVPYFCRPHEAMGMKGVVTVTP